MLKNFTPRLYQQTILGTAASKNTLVVLPTGLGKTAIALLLAVQRLHLYPQSKILLLSPTKPLCEQHLHTFLQHVDLPPEKFVLFTGSVSPDKRAELWKTSQIIISTPQGFENDIINKRIKLEEVSLLVFDEAHHATGDYAYVWIAQQYEKLAKYARILALTASPGSDLESVKEICTNLRIEKVEVRTESDPDVKQYIQPLTFEWIKVEFPLEFKKVQKWLQDCRQSKLLEAQHFGYCSSSTLTKGDLLGLQGELQQKVSSGEKSFGILRSISLIAEAMKVEHALELLETQGIQQLHSYFQKMQQEAVHSTIKAVRNLMLDENFKAAMYHIELLLQQKIEHPKLPRLLTLVQEQLQTHPQSKIIIFTQYRNSAEEIVRKLGELHISNNIFVGQAKKKGLGFSQKQQKGILDRFRIGDFQVLVATSVAEEGLDIPKVDKVIFYEPVPSAIRSIQRRGRTGRLEKGEVTVLITAGTRDEAYRWSAHHKEKRMHRNLEQLRSSGFLHKEEATLARYVAPEQAITVLADHREKDNRVVKELIDLGVSVKTSRLDSADYIVSGKVAVELKKIPDFVASLIDGRLLEQVKMLKQHFSQSVLIIEGEEDIYSVRKVHANAIRGLLASIALDFRVPILYTKNAKDTAALLAVMAKREQDGSRDFSYHEFKPRSIQEQLEFIVSSLPGVGVQTARVLLQHFGSLQKLFQATREELMAIDGIGDKTADRLLGLFKEEYGKGKITKQ